MPLRAGVGSVRPRSASRSVNRRLRSRSSFPRLWHVLAQHLADACLPAASLMPVCLQHVRVQPSCLIDLPVRLFGHA